MGVMCGAASDIDIASGDGNTISHELLETIRSTDGVKEVYGRRSAFNVPVQIDGYNTADLISYDDFDLRALKKDGALKKGSNLSKIYGNSSYVLAVSDKDIKICDSIQIGNESLNVAGLLKYDPFSENGMANGKLTLITSAKTFEHLTGISDYSLVMVQLSDGATDKMSMQSKMPSAKSMIFVINAMRAPPAPIRHLSFAYIPF